MMGLQPIVPIKTVRWCNGQKNSHINVRCKGNFSVSGIYSNSQKWIFTQFKDICVCASWHLLAIFMISNFLLFVSERYLFSMYIWYLQDLSEFTDVDVKDSIT